MKDPELRGRECCTMAPGTHSVWVAPSCLPALIHHFTPSWSPHIIHWDLPKQDFIADFKGILKHHTSSQSLVSQWKTIWDCLSVVTGHPWQKRWGEQNAQIFHRSWEGRVSWGMHQEYWQTTLPTRHTQLCELGSSGLPFSVSNDSHLLSLTASFTARNNPALSDLLQTFTFSHEDIDRDIFKVLLLSYKVRGYFARWKGNHHWNAKPKNSHN